MDILVDTISFRCNFHTFEDLLEFLNVDVELFEASNKVFNFNYCASLIYDGIRIAYGGSKDWEYYVHMSGKGCRTYEDLQGPDFKWEDLILKIADVKKDIYVTRIDLAADERTGVFNIDRLEQHIAEGRYVSKCKSIRLIKFSEECLYVGSPQSLSLLRIYNKKLERGFSESDEECPHWWRCEFQLRDEHAMQLVREWARSGNVGYVFSGHLKKHIKFTNTVNNKNGNQNEYIAADWWDDFLEASEALKWVSWKGSEYNLHKLQKYAIGNAGSSIQTLIKATKLTPEQLYFIYMNADIKLRPDQRSFIDKYNKYLERGGEPCFDDFVKVIKCDCCGLEASRDMFNIYRGSVGVCCSCESPATLFAFDSKYNTDSF